MDQHNNHRNCRRLRCQQLRRANENTTEHCHSSERNPDRPHMEQRSCLE
uniref:Uncharacterized protein n=1 Tax=Arundo donax TaxID=35708 RepID=A0A0A8Y3S6_ARUDO